MSESLLPDGNTRDLGQRVTELIARQFEELEGRPVFPATPPEELDRLFDEPLPEAGSEADALLTRLEQEIIPNSAQLPHPRFFAYVPGSSTPIAAYTEAIVAAANFFAGSCRGGASAARVESQVIRWLAELIDWPTDSGGLITSGGTMANLHALAAARRVHGGEESVRKGVNQAEHPFVAYASAEAHSCLERAMIVLGLGADHLRRVPVDENYRMNLNALGEAIAADRAAGAIPFCVIGTAGTTNTGAVDPLEDLAAICREEKLWFHIDGAYGGFAWLGPTGRERLEGMNEADSIALDPHKWLFVPYEAGCVLVKDPETLRSAFDVSADYLQDNRPPSDSLVNFHDYGIQLSRSFKALKIWMTLKHYGAQAVRDAVEQGLLLTRLAEERVRSEEKLELLSGAELGIIAFRYRADDGDHDAFNEQLTQAVAEDGEAFFSSTRLKGQYAIRMCILNHRTTENDVHRGIDAVLRVAGDL